MLHTKRVHSPKETTHELYQSMGNDTAGMIITSYHRGSRETQAADLRKARKALRNFVNKEPKNHAET